MMIGKVLIVTFSLLMLSSPARAECADNTPAECKDAKAVQLKQNGNTHPDQNAAQSLSTNSAARATTQPTPPSRKNKRRTDRQFPRFEPADPQDTVLSSEICVYSSATYTYTCR